jgi:hypothetical protein
MFGDLLGLLMADFLRMQQCFRRGYNDSQDASTDDGSFKQPTSFDLSIRETYCAITISGQFKMSRVK